MFRLLQTDIPPVLSLSDSLRVATESMVASLKDDPGTFFQELGKDAIHFSIKVVAALLIFIVGIWLIRWVKKMMSRSFQRKNTEKTVASFVTSITGISLTVLLIVIAISTLGINTTSLAAVLAAGGVAIGVSMSGTLQNFAGGLMVLIFKPFKVGDYIDAQGCSGTVAEVTMVNTKLRTVDNRVIVVPNGSLINGNIDNYSVNPVRRIDWNINVEYGSDVDVCMDTLTGIIKADSRVLAADESLGSDNPSVFLSSLNHDDISFTLRAWTRSENYWNLLYDINKVIYKRLPEAGISFASKRLDVTVSKKD